MQRTERMTALIQSCAKWREPFKTECGPLACPLCIVYREVHFRGARFKVECYGCPIAMDLGTHGCDGSPYSAHADVLETDTNDDSTRLAMYQYLRGLWKKEKAKCHK